MMGTTSVTSAESGTRLTLRRFNVATKPVVTKLNRSRTVHTTERWYGASGGYSEYNADLSGSTVDDTSMASLQYVSNGWMNVYGLSAGETQFWWTYTYAYEYDDGFDCRSVRDEVTTTEPVAVAPRINSLNPARGLIGTSLDVTINGQGFRSGATISAGSGITATVGNVTSTSVTVTFAIASNATAGNHAVTVTINGQTSNSMNFFVQIPTSLMLFTGARQDYNGSPLVDPNGVTQAGQFYGYARLLAYTVLDQSGSPIMATMTQAEHVTKVSSNPPIPGTADNMSPTTPDGTFVDFRAFGFSASPPPQLGEYLKQKQVIAISTSSGFSATVRVNCINKQYNDVTLTDVTATPNATCQ